MSPLKSCKVLSLEKALPFSKKCQYLSKSSNHFCFTPIMKLVLRTLKKMSQEENCKKVMKIFLRLFNKKSRELKVMEIRKSKYCEYEVAKCRKGGEMFLSNALNWTKILQFLITTSKNAQAVNKVECGKCKKGP